MKAIGGALTRFDGVPRPSQIEVGRPCMVTVPYP